MAYLNSITVNLSSWSAVFTISHSVPLSNSISSTRNDLSISLLTLALYQELTSRVGGRSS